MFKEGTMVYSQEVEAKETFGHESNLPVQVGRLGHAGEWSEMRIEAIPEDFVGYSGIYIDSTAALLKTSK